MKEPFNFRRTDLFYMAAGGVLLFWATKTAALSLSAESAIFALAAFTLCLLALSRRRETWKSGEVSVPAESGSGGLENAVVLAALFIKGTAMAAWILFAALTVRQIFRIAAAGKKNRPALPPPAALFGPLLSLIPAGLLYEWLTGLMHSGFPADIPAVAAALSVHLFLELLPAFFEKNEDRSEEKEISKKFPVRTRSCIGIHLLLIYPLAILAAVFYLLQPMALIPLAVALIAMGRAADHVDKKFDEYENILYNLNIALKNYRENLSEEEKKGNRYRRLQRQIRILTKILKDNFPD